MSAIWDWFEDSAFTRPGLRGSISYTEECRSGHSKMPKELVGIVIRRRKKTTTHSRLLGDPTEVSRSQCSQWGRQERLSDADRHRKRLDADWHADGAGLDETGLSVGRTAGNGALVAVLGD